MTRKEAAHIAATAIGILAGFLFLFGIFAARAAAVEDAPSHIEAV